jgi:ABC-type cobalt transport system substrate-binding protein
MKKTDIAMIILIASVSVLIAFFVTRSIFGGSANEPVNVKTIERIEPTLSEVDSTVFNENAINPAVEVQITPGNQ